MRQTEKLRQFFRDMTFERWMSLITTAATVAGLFSLWVAIHAYLGVERSAALERTHKTFADAQKIVTESENNDINKQFPGRWERVVRHCLKKDVAEKFLSAALHPGQAEYQQYNLARKHLNQVETVAFQYVHGLVDQDVVAASACQYIAKSNKYFRHLIGVFGAYLGPGQSWQVIPQAVEMMRSNPSCPSLPSEQTSQAKDKSPALTYTLPDPASAPAEWEEDCGT